MSTLAAGLRLGRYELVAPLGSGGMGSVWRARDTVLGRDVAIKVISPHLEQRGDALARFRREATTASALNHPALVTVFEVGEQDDTVFIAMQLVEGENLRHWLATRPPMSDTLDVLSQAAAGLAAAHENGVLHRDVKPENIMVTRDGFAKVVDFGLAKLLGQPSKVSGNEATEEKITQSHTMVGTVPYMSPEQICGEELDARSDIFSFGAVLYEAATGRRAFPGRTSTDVVRQILHDQVPTAPDVEPALALLITGCLEKRREARIGSMREVASRLRSATRSSTSARRPAPPRSWTIAGGLAAIAVVAAAAWFSLSPAREASPSAGTLDASGAVAVLPFDTSNAADRYISSAFADGVTTGLAKQSGLSVIARESATRYQSIGDFRRTSADLGARYLVLGSVARDGERLRVDARLVDGPARAVLWAEKYESAIGDVFSVQSRIAHDVARKLVPSRSVRAADTTPRDPGVAELYLRAKFFATDPLWPVQDQSIPLLEQVCAADPHFYPARVTLAQQYARRAFARDPDRSWEQKAFVAVEKLLRDFPDESEAYQIRGNLRYTMAGGFRYDEALADYDRSLAIDPNNVHAYNSRASLLMHYGLLEEALADYGRALKLDPFNEFAQFRVPRILMYQQKYAEAIEGWRRGGYRRSELAVTLDIASQRQEALRVAEDALKDNESDGASALAVVHARRGDRTRAEKEIARAIAHGEGSSHFHHAAYYIAAAYAQMGDEDRALHWLDRISREGMPCYPLFAGDVLLDPLRSSPRFRDFLERSRVEWERRRAARRPRV